MSQMRLEADIGLNFAFVPIADITRLVFTSRGFYEEGLRALGERYGG